MIKIAVFLKTVAEDNAYEIRQLSECGNLSPIEFSESTKNYTATKAVDWPNSQTIDETRLPGEQDNEYTNRMKSLTNEALGDLSDGLYEAAIMSVPLFISARGN